MKLTQYDVAIRLRFWAEDEDHAIEQFVNAVEDDAAAWVNDIKETEE